jgi:hypothetical protein
VGRRWSDIDQAVFTVKLSRRLNLAEKSRLQLNLQRQRAVDLELHLYPTDAINCARRLNFYS